MFFNFVSGKRSKNFQKNQKVMPGYGKYFILLRSILKKIVDDHNSY